MAYQKQTFTDYETVLCASHLDQVENGIIALEEEIEEVATRLNTVANSTDTDLDQLAELVEYIKDNRELIDAIDVPTKLSDLTDDSTHRTVTDTEKSAWSNKSDFSGSYTDLTNKPTIPTVPSNISVFQNDVGYITENDLTAKGYQTAEQVQTLIDNSLGVIENGTY